MFYEFKNDFLQQFYPNRFKIHTFHKQKVVIYCEMMREKNKLFVASDVSFP